MFNVSLENESEYISFQIFIALNSIFWVFFDTCLIYRYYYYYI